jgi:CRISPR-associated protein Csm3
MSTSIFDRYSILYKFDGAIIAQTPLRIGKGSGYKVIEPDLPVIKNSLDVPIIPGSSIKGFFRANATRLLMNLLSKEKVESLIKEIFGGTEENEHSSSILFSDMPAKSYKIENRKHIRIDPEKGSVVRGALFEIECVMDGAVFEGTFATIRNLSPIYMSILTPITELASLGICRLGGFKSRGYGHVKFEFKKMTITLPGIKPENLANGAKIEPTIPTERPQAGVLIQAKNGNIKLKEIQEITFSGRVEPSVQYFGTSIIVEGDEINRLMVELVKQLQKALEKTS